MSPVTYWLGTVIAVAVVIITTDPLPKTVLSTLQVNRTLTSRSTLPTPSSLLAAAQGGFHFPFSVKLPLAPWELNV